MMVPTGSKEFQAPTVPSKRCMKFQRFQAKAFKRDFARLHVNPDCFKYPSDFACDDCNGVGV